MLPVGNNTLLAVGFSSALRDPRRAVVATEPSRPLQASAPLPPAAADPPDRRPARIAPAPEHPDSALRVRDQAHRLAAGAPGQAAPPLLSESQRAAYDANPRSEGAPRTRRYA